MDLFQPSPRCRNRLELACLLRDKGLLGEALEVGVWRGDFSLPFFEVWGGRRLHLVDPWERLDPADYDDVRNRDFDPADYAFVRERFAPHGRRVNFWRMTSTQAVEHFADNQLDFVYIDANHAYSHVRADMEAWWPKVKPGGVLAGHDLFSMSHPGVTAAVAEFCLARGLVARTVMGDFNETGMLVNAHSWYLEKP